MEEKVAEVDLSKLSLQELLDHKSWKARLKGYEDINTSMQQATSGKDAIFTKYGNGIKAWASDSNVNALEKGLDAVLTFVENASNAQRSAQDVCPVLVQKCLAHTKQKIREKSLEILLMYIEIEKPDVVTDALIEGFANKNPKVVTQSIAAFASAVSAFGVQAVNFKNVMKHIAPLLENRDKDVRQQTKLLAVELFRWIGGIALKPQLQNIKPLQLAELEEEFSKEKEAKTAPVPTRYLRSQKPKEDAQLGSGVESQDSSDAPAASSAASAPQAADPWDYLEPVDVLKKLPGNFFEQIESPKWAERKECLEILLKLCADNPKLDTTCNYGELVSVLKKIIAKDSNINVVSFAAKCVAAMAEGLRKKFSQFTSMLFPIILEKFKDKKPIVTNACTEAVDAIFKTTTLEAISEDLVAALDNKTPTVKSQTALFMSRAFAASHPTVLTKKLLKIYCAALVKNIESSVEEVRNSAASALGAALKVAGEKNVMPFLAEIKDDHLKMDKIKECCEKTIIDPALVAQSAPVAVVSEQPASKQPAKVAAKPEPKKAPAAVAPARKPQAAQPVKESSEESKSTEETKPTASNRSQSAARKPGESAKTKKDSETTTLDSSPLIDTNQKAQRFQEEKALRILKWNFTTPTDEHVEQLQTQLATICKPTLHANLFHANFKMHIKALESLTQCVEMDPDSSINGSDLLLKWCTLRFFETNPSVLLKSLEYIQLLLQLMLDRQVELHDYEVTSFVPYLLLKAGDQKDAVRNEVRKIIKKLVNLYPATKLFQLILDSCKATKNSRQKAECLEQLGSFIDMLGVLVCGNPPTQSLKTIAQCIGEKDTTVRNAALNTIVSAYNHLGDKVHKVIGPMNEKDFTMLQERIKRSSKAKPAGAAPLVTAVTGQTAATATDRRPRTAQPVLGGRQSPLSATSNAYVNNNNSEHAQTARNASRSPSKRHNNYNATDTNSYGGNDDYNDDNEQRPYRLEMSKIFNKAQQALLRRFGQRQPMPPSLIRPEVERDLADPFQRPRIDHRRAATARGRSPAAYASDVRTGGGPDSLSRGQSDEAAMDAINIAISHVASMTMATAIQALVQLDEILKDHSKSNFLVGKVDPLVLSIFFQLKMACNTRMKDTSCDPNEVLRLYRHLCVVLLSLCSNNILIQEASDGVLKDLICQLLTVLIDDRLSKTTEGSELIRSINMLVVNLVTKSDHTVCLVALLRLLRDVLHSQTASAKFQDLVMKCLWKLSRQLPNFADQLQLDRILAECHQFLIDFPGETWKNRPSNMPLRTVKTILNSLCNIFGDKILDHVSMIDRAESSEAVQYLKKCLVENFPPNENDEKAAASSQRASNAASKNGSPADEDNEAMKKSIALQQKEEIMGILRRVGDKDLSKQGLLELYEFLQEHKEFDMEPFYRKCSPQFRAYIEKNLNRLQLDRVGINGESNEARETNPNEPYSVTSETGINAILKLQKLRERCGLEPLKVLTPIKQNDSKTNLNNLALGDFTTREQSRQSNNEDRRNKVKPAEEVMEEAQPDISVEDLRARLERVKKGGGF